MAEHFVVGVGGTFGRFADATFVLPHPLVSRAHARLVARNGRVVVTDLTSASGTFVNGVRIRAATPLAPGDRLDIGPFSLNFDGRTLSGVSRSNNSELAARGITRVVAESGTGRALTLVDGVSLVVRPRELVALIGPSGSGKSTLLGLLSGRVAPESGAVLVNGRNLHRNFPALKQGIAVVPQREALHTGLTVGAALGYTAELRLPPDTSRAEVAAAVDDLLGAVGLGHRRDTPIRLLSGGQLKRASLANELAGRPSLLFLDEVTSGLDEQADREVMGVFRQVAGAGKTVVCVTHNLANVEAHCHLVVVLAEGGRLAFVGKPVEAREYFGIKQLGDVYQALAARPADAWRKQFAAHPCHRRYVADRLPAEAPPDPPARPNPGGAAVAAARQGWVLLRRYLSVWRAAPGALVAMLGQSLLVAALLVTVFGDVSAEPEAAVRAGRAVNLFFLLNVSCLWLGCNAAARELVKEREIFTRERAFNVRTDSYLASKAAVLTALAVAQATLVFGVVEWCCDPPGAAAGRWCGLVLLAAAGTGLGLLISAAAATEEVALSLVPVVVIPQIVLAGVVAPLSGVGKWAAAAAVTCYWGQRGLDALLPETEQAAAALADHSFAAQFAVVVGHAAAYYTLTILVLTRKVRAGRSAPRRPLAAKTAKPGGPA